jgi:uncharacterized protein (TIGR03437 family)
MRLLQENRVTVSLVIAVACPIAALSQLPQVTSNGVVSAASWSSPVAPGQLISIFGTNLATTPQMAGAPLPLTLAGTSVTINGITAPLAFVSPTQINAQVPSSLTITNWDVVTAKVVVSTPAGSGAPANLALTAANPGIFTAGASGCGQAAALNVTPGLVSVNSPWNSAAPGDYIALFGTGLGLIAQAPPDGAAASVPAPLPSMPSLLFDNKPGVVPSYAGLAPGLVGVDQINFQIPASTRNGCAVPVSISRGFNSPSVTIAVQAGRGQCTDPAIRSYGRIALSKAVYSEPGNNPIPAQESFTAFFPSGPDVQPPAPERIVFAPNYAEATSNALTARFISTDGAVLNLRACPVPGYTQLSAGAIRIQPPTGNSVAVQPEPLQTSGVVYGQSLPGGFIGSGIFTISGTQGSDVQLQTPVAVGSPIQLQTVFPPGTAISSSQPLTIKWTGGDPGTLVRLSFFSGEGPTARYVYSYANAVDGVLTMSPLCPANVPVSCSAALSPSPNTQISVQVLPDPTRAANLPIPGLTGSLTVTWQYTWNFSGLKLGQ